MGTTGGRGQAGGRGPADAATEAAADVVRVERLADGDVEALGELFQRHGGALFAVARRMVGDDADDLVHDVFVEAWRHAATYAPERASVRTWLLVRCRSRALDRLRSARARRSVALGMQERAPEAAAPEAGGAGLDGARAWAALEALPTPQRHVIELAYFGGLSASEIAAQIGAPVGTVKSRTAAALRALRGQMGDGVEGR